MRRIPVLAVCLAVGGCMVGPDYHRPAAIVSARYKELAPAPGWQRATPSLASARKGDWWLIYDDPMLDGLEAQVVVSNQNVKSAEAAYRQARALVDEARAGLFPTLAGSFNDTRSAFGSGGRTVSSTLVGGLSQYSGSGTTQTTYQLEGTASWDLDVWGRIRRQVESDVAGAQVSAADLANAALSAQAELATAYFDLRTEDTLQDLLDRTLASYAESLRITQNQYNAGYLNTSPIALLQAKTQLEQTRAQAISVGVARSQDEHAIAVLTGRPPAALSLAPQLLARRVPPIPVTLPALLLQRRPDIAAAERTMEQENALIGVEIAAFFPDISLSAAYGWSGDPIGALIQLSSRVWSLGVAASENIFEGGLRSAAVRAARATYDEAVANYRQTVLTALQDTEDDLAGLRILGEEAEAQARAVALSEQAVTVALNQYRAGVVDYTTVVTSQTTALSNEESAISIQQQRLVDSVSLIQQMGGGWTTADLPSKDQLQTNNPLVPAFLDHSKPPPDGLPPS